MNNRLGRSRKIAGYKNSSGEHTLGFRDKVGAEGAGGGVWALLGPGAGETSGLWLSARQEP